MNRTDRLLAIVLELQARGRITAEDLARSFEISKRTVYRDIKALNESGVPIVSAPGRGYWLMEGYFLPPISFSANETTMLLLGARLMQQSFDEQYKEAAISAQRKIEAVLRPELKGEVKYLSENIRFFSNRADESIQKLLTQLRRAIIEQKIVSFDYTKRFGEDKDKPMRRLTHPHSLLSLNGIWMITAYCRLRKAMRLFRLDRIENLELTDEHFEREKAYALKENKETLPLKVELLFKKSVARWLKESPSFYIREYEEREDGIYVFLRVRTIDEILSWVLGWGDNVLVLEPKQLKEQILQIAEQHLSAYKTHK